MGFPLLLAVGSGAWLVTSARWQPPTIAPDRLVATVHGEPITWAAIAERLDAARVMGRPVPGDLASWEAEVTATVESAINDVLTRHIVEGQGLTVSEAQVEAEMEQLRDRYGGEAQLTEAMAAMRVSVDQLRENQRRGLYYQALIELSVPVATADVEAYRSQAGAAGLSWDEAVARVRDERAATVIPQVLTAARGSPGISVVPINELSGAQ